MTIKSVPVKVSMKSDTELENITRLVEQTLNDTGLQAGILTLFVKHTTASVMIIEDEPGIREDTKTIWARLIPADREWQHNTRNAGEDNAHSHLRAQLQGCSITVPFDQGRLSLGTWQQIVLVDFDTRPRTRDLIIQMLGE